MYEFLPPPDMKGSRVNFKENSKRRNCFLKRSFFLLGFCLFSFLSIYAIFFLDLCHFNQNRQKDTPFISISPLLISFCWVSDYQDPPPRPPLFDYLGPKTTQPKNSKIKLIAPIQSLLLIFSSLSTEWRETLSACSFTVGSIVSCVICATIRANNCCSNLLIKITKNLFSLKY